MATYGHTFTSGDTVTPTKLNAARTVSDIVNADISATAAIAATKLASDSITNTQIKSDAAIAGTKIAPNFGSQNITTTGLAGIGMAPTGAAGLEVVNDVSIFKYAALNAVIVRRANGTQSSPTIVANNDGIGRFLGAGYDGSEYRNAGQISIEVDGTPGASDMPGRIVLSTTADGSASPTERMRINSSGSVLIGTTTEGNVGAYFLPSTNQRMVLSCGTDTTSSNSLVNFRNTNGIVGAISTNGSATVYGTSSDYRLKEGVTPLTGGLEIINQIRACEFKWKSDNSIGRGFIAHELQAVVPEAVSGHKDAVDAEGNPEYQGVDASKLVPYLVSAVKELKARVEELEAA